MLAHSSTRPTPPSTVAPVTKPAEQTIQATPVTKAQTAEDVTKQNNKQIVVNTDNPSSTQAKTVPVIRIQSLIKGQTWLVFAVGLLTGLAATVLLLKHALSLRHLLRGTENFVLRHPVLDAVLVGAILIGSFMLQTNGYLR